MTFKRLALIKEYLEKNSKGITVKIVHHCHTPFPLGLYSGMHFSKNLLLMKISLRHMKWCLETFSLCQNMRLWDFAACPTIERAASGMAVTPLGK